MKNISYNYFKKYTKRNIKHNIFIYYDLRNYSDFTKSHLNNFENISYNELFNNYNQLLSFNKRYFFICYKGDMSKKIAIFLRKKRYHTISIKHGYNSIKHF